MQFHYTAKKGPNDLVEGTLEADHRDQAVSRVTALGLIPVDISEVRASAPAKNAEAKARRPTRAGVAFKDVVAFTRQMSDLTEAAVPILRSLQIVIKQTSRPELRNILSEIHDMVRDGMPLSQALMKYSRIFPSYYPQMINAGEAGGQLDVIFRRLADSLEKQQDMRLKVQSSLAYPLLILGVGLMTVFILVTFIIPKISVMFEDTGQALPLPTLILLKLSAWLSSFWWLILIATGFGIFSAARWINTEQGRRGCDEMILKIPAVGNFLKMAACAQFCRTLSTLIESGVPLNSALDAAARTVDNTLFRSQIDDLSRRITAGESLSAGLQRVSFFPEMLVNMIAVGEETGHLEKSLAKAADTYERQTDETMRAVISLLGPLVLVIVVGIVGCVVLALLLPILQMNLLIQ